MMRNHTAKVSSPLRRLMLNYMKVGQFTLLRNTARRDIVFLIYLASPQIISNEGNLTKMIV